MKHTHSLSNAVSACLGVRATSSTLGEMDIEEDLVRENKDQILHPMLHIPVTLDKLFNLLSLIFLNCQVRMDKLIYWPRLQRLNTQYACPPINIVNKW